MEKLFFYIFWLFIFCNTGFAEKISFLNIKIGDKITDHFTNNQIYNHYMDDDKNTTNSKGEKVYGRNQVYSYIAIIYDNNEMFKEDYSNSGIQIYFENETDKIVSIGKVDTAINLSTCIIRRNRDVNTYKSKKRINSLFNKDEKVHEFPTGTVDHYVSFTSDEKFFSFRCYVYPDGSVTKRFQAGTNKFGNYVFERFNDS